MQEIAYPFIGRIGSGLFRFVSVLLLAGGKYYVGTTADPVRRIREHWSESGAAGTSCWRPLAVLESSRFRDCFYAGRAASERLEMHIGSVLARRMPRQVQGARQSSGGRSAPTTRNARVLRRNERFSQSQMGRRFLDTVEAVDRSEWPWELRCGYRDPAGEEFLRGDVRQAAEMLARMLPATTK